MAGTLRITRRLWHPRAGVIAHDLVMVWLAWQLAYLFRLWMQPAEFFSVFAAPGPMELLAVLVAQGGVLALTGLYRGIWRFASVPDLWNIIRATVYGTLLITLTLFMFNRLEGVPRAVFLFYPLLLPVLLGLPRLINRIWKDHGLRFESRPGGKRVLIIGAGSAGDILARDLRADRAYHPVGFLDDDERLIGGKLRGLPIFGQVERLPAVVRSKAVDLVIIAIPSASSRHMQRIVEICEDAGVEFRTMPRLQDVLAGRSDVKEIREVAIDDLLGREPMSLDWAAIQATITGKSVFITGGGGSIGSELARQIAKLGPARLAIVENSEFALYQVERELRRDYPGLLVDARLGDVTDERLIERLLEEIRCDVLFHAAAYKHVPLLQTQTREAVRNNVIGTVRVARAAEQAGVKTFVLISTDKAVNPVNIMGATKRAAEIFCQNFGSSSRTRFVTVRFGNVLDSAGSVVPLFREQIAAGGPVTVTHPEIMRYFMTIPEACQLILQVAQMGEGGEIFALDMGAPVKIRYLAEQMVKLSGKRPGKDIRIIYTGLRPGEKLFEELFHEHEAYSQTAHRQVLQAQHRRLDLARLEQLLIRLDRAVTVFDEPEIEALLFQLIPEYDGESDTTRKVHKLHAIGS